MKTQLALLLCIISLSLFAQPSPSIEWTKTYTKKKFETIYSVLQTDDRGYILAGYVDGDKNSDGWLIKVNTEGKVEWEKLYDHCWADRFYSITKTADGGYIACGISEKHKDDGITKDFSISSNAWLVKLTNKGDVQWQQQYGGSKNDGFSKVIQTKDGGYAICGYTRSNDVDVSGNHSYVVGPNAWHDGWVLKTDSKGDVEWKKCIGGADIDSISSILQTPDEGFVVAGYTGSPEGDITGFKGGYDGFVAKLDKTGKTEWLKCIGGGGLERITSIKQTTDGGFIAVGNSNYNSKNKYTLHTADGWVIKLNATGNIKWQKCIGNIKYGSFNYVEQTKDGGYIMCGTIIPKPTKKVEPQIYSNVDAWVVKLDSLGKVEWDKIIGGKKFDKFNSVIQTSDGNYILAGHSASKATYKKGGRYDDGLVVKLGPVKKRNVKKSTLAEEIDIPVPEQNNTPPILLASNIKKPVRPATLQPAPATDTITAPATLAEEPTGRDTAITPSIGIEVVDFLLYPNPTDRILYIKSEFKSDDNVVIQLTDMAGNILYTVTQLVSTGPYIQSLELLYPAGNYLVTIITSKGRFTKPVIIVR